MENVSEPLDLETAQTTFGSTNLKQALPVVVHQTYTIFKRKFSQRPASAETKGGLFCLEAFCNRCTSVFRLN